MALQFNLQIPATLEVIKTETTKFREMIKERQSEIELLHIAISHYQKQCSHPGQKTGYNECDGDWTSPCPVCGECH